MIKIIWIVLLLSGPSAAYGENPHPIAESQSRPQKVFQYRATRLGVPFLKATIKIEDGSSEQKGSLVQVHAFFYSLPYLGYLFRMNNRFTSTLEAGSLSPVRYVKEIDQGGIFIKNKNYTQTIVFDSLNKKAVIEKNEMQERQEVPIPLDTYDPLSLFARYYLKEDFHPGQDIQMSIFDGVKLRQLIFYSRKDRIQSRLYGEVEAVRLESSTSFSTFGEKEGIIRIWYTADGERTPLLIELDLPVGKVKFELDEVKED